MFMHVLANCLTVKNSCSINSNLQCLIGDKQAVRDLLESEELVQNSKDTTDIQEFVHEAEDYPGPLVEMLKSKRLV